jgi:hypothetical protein
VEADCRRDCRRDRHRDCHTLSAPDGP